MTRCTQGVGEISRGKGEVLKKLELIKLNYVFEHFYAEVKTTKGTDYEPDFSKVILASIDRHS